MINRDIFLIGTNHKYQHNSPLYGEVSPDAINEFKQYISTVYRQYNIQAIGEEMHRSDLMKDRDKSVPKEVALELGDIPHKYCSPNDQESRKLGYKDFLYKEHTETDDEWEKRVFENDKIKELGWIKNILTLDKWPLLFICGSLHVDSFSHKVETEGMKAITLSENWIPLTLT